MYLLVGILSAYVASYGGMRLAGFYVHGTWNYEENARHRIQVGNHVPIITIPSIGMLALHYPLKTIEEHYWRYKDAAPRE